MKTTATSLHHHCIFIIGIQQTRLLLPRRVIVTKFIDRVVAVMCYHCCIFVLLIFLLVTTTRTTQCTANIVVEQNSNHHYRTQSNNNIINCNNNNNDHHRNLFRNNELVRNNDKRLQATSLLASANSLPLTTTGSSNGMTAMKEVTSSSLAAVDSSTTSGSLYNYLETAIKGTGVNGLCLLRWDEHGYLINSTTITSHPYWFSELDFIPILGRTQPSRYGKVALLYNSDFLKRMEQEKNMYPPVPTMFYTIGYNFVNRTNVLLIPNPYDRKGANERQIERIQQFVGPTNFNLTFPIYKQRQATIVWRGSTHGELDQARHILVNMSSILRQNNNPDDDVDNDDNSTFYWLDAAQSDAFATSAKNIHQNIMISQYRYQIDIGGVSGTSWGGLRWKMCGGGLIFKVDTWSIDWWHPTIHAWEHYIPVYNNLSNLYEQYQWAQSHPRKAYAIAAAGQQKCLETYTEYYAKQTLIDIIKTLPPATEDIVNEADSIFANDIEYFFPEE